MSDTVPAIEGCVPLLDVLTAELLLYVHLYTNDPDLGLNTKLTDFVEVIWDGYEPLAVSPWTPGVLNVTQAYSFGDPAIFTWPGGTVPLPVRGYYATIGPTGPYVWGWRRPGDPFQFDADNDTLTVNVRATMTALAAA